MSGGSSDGDSGDVEGGLFGEGGLLGLGWSGGVFLGFEVDLTGGFGIEFGAGLVLDLDTPTDSGFYESYGYGGGANFGYGVGVGYAWGDIEGSSAGVDVNLKLASVQVSIGDDGQPVVGFSIGPGIGASFNEAYTNTYAPFR